MLKILGILIGGVFVGAVAMEVVHKKYPDGTDKLCEKTKEATSEMKRAFKNGYDSAAHPKTATA
ncbi:hypothetical protein ACFL3G_00420 [Planctomycetota bacterium]